MADAEISTTTASIRPLGPLRLYLLALLIGAVASLGALFFRVLIGLFHNAFFLGQLSPYYDASIHTPASPWGAGVVLVPVVGGMGVAFLVQHFAPETKGHGVPEVMDAIYYKKGVIRPVVVLIKSLASALSIGSGASVGREGPIVQIGSAFGSTVGGLLKLPTWQRLTLIAAGAGGGIAATFNTPVGGLLFAIELLLHEISVRTVLPVTIATVTAAYFGRFFFGAHPAFVIPAFQKPDFVLTNPEVLLAFLLLGALLGVASAIYIKSIYAFEDFFERVVPRSYYLRHAVGMLASGALMYTLFLLTGAYHVEGVGYATVQQILTGSLQVGSFLILLFLLKILATSLALGSGASGGIFSPGLYVGATFGGAFGVFLHQLFPGLPIDPAAFAVAGMAGLVGGATGATVTAIVMIMEMTFDYSVVIPLTFTVAMSYGVRRFITRQSIYTLKLARRGHYIPEALYSGVHELRRARDIMDRRFVVLPASSPTLAERTESRWIVWSEEGRVEWITDRSEPQAAEFSPTAKRQAGGQPQNFIFAREEATLVDLIARMGNREVEAAIIVRDDAATSDGVVGIVGKKALVDAMADALEIFSG
ncbi:MAG TPA: chloride channel protein [Geomonas sp.]|nr:chloride channel protein [Geomonas sp.]